MHLQEELRHASLTVGRDHPEAARAHGTSTLVTRDFCTGLSSSGKLMLLAAPGSRGIQISSGCQRAN